MVSVAAVAAVVVSVAVVSADYAFAVAADPGVAALAPS